MSAAASARPGATGRARLGADACLMAASLAAGLGTARLTQAPGSAHVLGPIVATVVAGHLASSLARRARVSIAATAVSGVVAVALATVWGQFLSATRSGIPTSSTWRALVAQFDAAGTVIRSHPTPVPATPGVVLCIATGAGLVAVLGRTVWAWAEARPARPLATLAALVPTFGLFCYTALLSSQVDRIPGLVAYLGCALVFLAVADQPAAGAGARAGSRAGTPVGTVRRGVPGLLTVLPAILTAATAVAVPLALSPAVSALKVNALPFGSAPGTPGAGGLAPGGAGPGGGASLGDAARFDPGATGVRAIDLVDDIRAVLTDRTGDVMFRATTPEATYWQVAVLTNFDGTAWVPDPTTQAAALAIAQPTQSRSVPGLPVLPEPAPVTTFRVEVTMGDLQSTLLPLPPTTVSVAADAAVVPGFGAVEPIEAPPGQRYSAVARVPAGRATRARSTRPGAPVGTAGAAGPVTAPDPAPSSLAPYLAMPAIAPRVVELAHQIVRGAATPAAQAAALARWFDNGRFRYSLSPPVVAGGDPLSAFLFTTKAGFCQQFAAAYAVLARLDGLPTRVAVGFTTGTALDRDHYQVTGADAHVWPEVYLGPATGWTSYEPTPASSGEPTGVGVNSGSRGGTQNGGPRTTAAPTSTVSPLHHSFASPVSAPSTVPLARRGGRAAAGHNGVGRGGGGWVLVVAIGAGLALVALALWAGLVRPGPRPRRGSRWAGVRRQVERWRDERRRRRGAADPTAEVLAQWRRAVSALDRARLGRQPTETVQEHAARLQSLAGAKWLATYAPVAVAPGGGREPASTASAVEAAVDAYTALATLADRAAYGAGPSTVDEALGAQQLSAVVRSGLVRSGLDRGRSRAADPVPV